MKYIMFQTAEGMKLPVIFPDTLTHVFVAGAMQLVFDTLDPKKDLRPRQLLQMLERASAPPVSAGFVGGLGTDVVVSGESESLGDLKSVPADAARIILGESIQFMPDAIAVDLASQLKDRLLSGIDSDLAIAIGEHAFRAGFAAAEEALGAHGSDRLLDAIESAWSDYSPPDELCGVALVQRSDT